jgi:hypothetical protein
MQHSLYVMAFESYLVSLPSSENMYDDKHSTTHTGH